MSDTRRCMACGLPFNTGITDEEQYCEHCDETTAYSPQKVPDVEEGDKVSHLYFTGTVRNIVGRYLDDSPSTVEITIEQSSWGQAQGVVEMSVNDLNPA